MISLCLLRKKAACYFLLVIYIACYYPRALAPERVLLLAFIIFIFIRNIHPNLHKKIFILCKNLSNVNKQLIVAQVCISFYKTKFNHNKRICLQITSTVCQFLIGGTYEFWNYFQQWKFVYNQHLYNIYMGIGNWINS